MKINFLKKLREKKISKYLHELGDPIYNKEYEIDEIKQYFESKGFRYIGKKHLNVPEYSFNRVFIVFYHPHHKFIITAWENHPYNPEYSLQEIAYRTVRNYPVSDARKFLNWTIDRIYRDLLEHQKQSKERKINDNNR